MAEATGPVLLTGAAGRVGSALRPMLRDRGQVRLADIAEPELPLHPSETFQHGDLRDPAYVHEITAGVSAIVHLAGEADPAADWARLVESNIMINAQLLDAACANGVPRLVIASSVHAIGGINDPDHWPVPAAAPARPCCPYGVSKAAVETLARLYADEVAGSHVVCLRLALVTHPVRWRQEARAWLADDDLRSLVAAALDAPVDYGIYVGASDCARPRFDIGNAASELGWRPAVRVAEDGLPELRPDYAHRCRLWLR